MTENEAKSKWCPMVRADGGVNNRADEYTGTNCVGRACMMWRRNDGHGNFGATPDERKALELKYAADTQGYCGLAGKP